MSSGRYAAASFALLRDATAAIDWFRNQRIDPAAIVVAVQAPGHRLRWPQRGDNQRADLTWFVALDLEAIRLPRAIIRDAFQREGGKNLSHAPSFPAQTLTSVD